jgi:hypothetical protein
VASVTLSMAFAVIVVRQSNRAERSKGAEPERDPSQARTVDYTHRLQPHVLAALAPSTFHALGPVSVVLHLALKCTWCTATSIPADGLRLQPENV